MADRIAAARAWLAHDPDPFTRAQLEDLIAEGADALADQFDARLVFGTAGIRGAQGPGPNRMNRVTVRRLGVGVARHLGPGTSVVIGFDARTNSDLFAADLAAVLSHAGIEVRVLPEPTPTPVLAFAVRYLDTDLGLMVTASHNPPADNGCKVFLAGGAQLRSPVDAQIDALVETAELPPPDLVAVPGFVVTLDESVQRAYEAAICDNVDLALAPDQPEPVAAYTPMHGVGHDTLVRTFAKAGLAPPAAVESQRDPDPTFPTVAFPNPEEDGAMDALVALATQIDADVALANDPDADRLAIAVPVDGAWRALTGDELGAVLCDHALRHSTGPDRLVVSTVVCSSLVATMAAAAGATHRSTLTGFKWIMAAAYDDPALRPVFAYEESIGYAVTEAVRDKDGISAALAVVGIVAELAAQGSTIAQRLDEIAVEHGLHTTRSFGLRFDGPGGLERAGAVVDGLRSDPPDALGERRIVEATDYIDGHDGLAPTNLLRFDLDGGIRMLMRPSGTEPKAKIYLELIDQVPDLAAVPVARSAAATTLDTLAEAITAQLQS